MLFHGEHVHRPDPLHLPDDLVQLLPELLGLPLDGLGVLHELLEGPSPLSLEAVLDSADPALQILTLQLQPVTTVRGLPLRRPGLPNPPLRGVQGFGHIVEGPVLLPQRLPGLLPVLEEALGGLLALPAQGPGLLELFLEIALLGVEGLDPLLLSLPALLHVGEAFLQPAHLALQPGGLDGQLRLQGSDLLPLLLNPIEVGPGLLATLPERLLLLQECVPVLPRGQGPIQGPGPGRPGALELPGELVPALSRPVATVELGDGLGLRLPVPVLGAPKASPSLFELLLGGPEVPLGRRPGFPGHPGVVLRPGHLVPEGVDPAPALQDAGRAPGIAQADDPEPVYGGAAGRDAIRPGRTRAQDLILSLHELHTVQEGPDPGGALPPRLHGFEEGAVPRCPGGPLRGEDDQPTPSLPRLPEPPVHHLHGPVVPDQEPPSQRSEVALHGGGELRGRGQEVRQGPEDAVDPALESSLHGRLHALPVPLHRFQS